MSKAFLIGNGPSRAEINLNTLDGVTYGCNALYRDFSPDYLIAVDQKMQEEILASGYTGTCIFRPHKGKTYPDNVIESEYNAVNNSGIVAFYYILKHQHFTVYTLGMDFSGGNIYAGTENYKRHKEPKVRRDVFDTWDTWIKKNSHLVSVYNYITGEKYE